VSSFSLDTFEVTVKRFRNFVDAYPTSIPGAAAGRNRHNGKDPGWNTDWNALLPQGQEALRLYLSNQSCPGSTFTAAAPVNDFVAMNCVSWYLAYAFCAWDGGRLPTEAEWNYAAAAGDENRYYPWSVPPTSTTIQPDQATYRSGVNNPTGPAIVGTASAGVARWGQFDLAGNVAEWVLDAWADPYAETAQCNDCANMNWGTNLRVLRGGSYASSAQLVRVGFRSNAAADDHFVAYGFRCARDL
jgi:formylglycine-generating enzyme required for sulfatase activity